MTHTTNEDQAEEVNISLLPENEQVSDDFLLYTDGELFYAIRSKGSKDKLMFCEQAKSKDHVVSKAVGIIDAYLSIEKDRVAFVPFTMVDFYKEV